MSIAYQGLVFFDLDSTLLNHQSLLSQSTLIALHRLQQNHYLPIINTGRSPNEIRTLCDQAQISTFCALNGSYIEHHGDILYKGAISTATIRSVTRMATTLGDALAFYSSDNIVSTEKSDKVSSAYHFIHTPVPPVEPKFYLSHEILMLLIFTLTNDEQYRNKFPELSLYRNTPYSIDTVSSNNSKQTGMQHLVEKLGAHSIPTYAFGDGTNDIPMLQEATYGIAMGNAIPKAKSVADYVTTSNDDDGIFNGLKHYGLI